MKEKPKKYVINYKHPLTKDLVYVDLCNRKIDLADNVFVMNIGGYIGESTRSEINYAEKTGKPIEDLEQLQNSGDKLLDCG